MVTKKVNGKTFKYDENKYDINYSKNQGIIILKKKCNNEILKVFDNNVMFILQYDNISDDSVDFVVGERSIENCKKGLLYHYKEDSDSLTSYLISKLENVDLEKCMVSDRTFITKEGHCDNKYVLYNLEGISSCYSDIIIDKRLKEYLGDNKVFVKQIRSFNKEHENGYIDILTYVIDTEDYKICSPIKSDLQDRFIRVYSDEEIERIKKEYSEQDKSLNTNQTNEEITIELEIDKYIKLLNKDLEQRTLIKDNKVNKEYVMKFINKNN